MNFNERKAAKLKKMKKIYKHCRFVDEKCVLKQKKKKSKIQKLNKRFGTNEVYFKKSELPNAGLGAFAKVNIPKGKRLGYYKGREIGEKEESYSKSKYIFVIHKKNGKNKYIDAENVNDSNFTHFVNAWKTKSQQKLNNVRYYQYKQQMWLKTMKKIPKDTELIADYGKTWNWDK